MNKTKTAIIASTVTSVIFATLLLSGIAANAATVTSSTGPNYVSSPANLTVNPYAASKIIVDISSPFGYEEITSFKVVQTANLMQQTGYYTLRLEGPIMNDKSTLLPWIAQDLGNLPDGLAAKGVTAKAGEFPVITEAKLNTMIDTIPVKGTVTVKMLQANQDAYDTNSVLELKFSGCHVAGYDIGTKQNERATYLNIGIQHVEQIIFACTNVQDLHSRSSLGNRGINVETAINDDGREIMNEKGELIITSREYREPIVVESLQKSVKLEIVTSIETDKASYKTGEAAIFAVTFADLEGNPIDPDAIKAYYDGKTVQLEQQYTGVYVYTTDPLAKADHQFILSAEKAGFATDTAYLSIPLHRIG
jgi:hypothetical protein